LDLGLDINGPNFKEHIKAGDDQLREPVLQFKAGGIRAAFEGNGPFIFDSLSGLDRFWLENEHQRIEIRWKEPVEKEIRQVHLNPVKVLLRWKQLWLKCS
jgi:hypothetical protein